jgi:hypothetical protein
MVSPLEQGWRAAATDGKTSLSRSLRLAHFSAARASANAALRWGHAHLSSAELSRPRKFS